MKPFPLLLPLQAFENLLGVNAEPNDRRIMTRPPAHCFRYDYISCHADRQQILLLSISVLGLPSTRSSSLFCLPPPRRDFAPGGGLCVILLTALRYTREQACRPPPLHPATLFAATIAGSPTPAARARGAHDGQARRRRGPT